jgi:indolepyruvate ferredoxin oxidoreductase alpha subunit
VLVVDASVALPAALSVDGFARLRGHDLVAPPLLWSEAVSALRGLRWRGDLTDAQADTAVAALLAAPIRRRSPRALHRTAWRLARDLGWAKTYDAEYVALAQLARCRLLTRDARLQRRVGGLVEVIGPADL